MAMLGEDFCRFSLVTEALKEERNELVSVNCDGVGGQLQAQQEDQPGMHVRERLGFEKLKQMEREDMQKAPNAEGIYDFMRNNGESPHNIATIPCCC